MDEVGGYPVMERSLSPLSSALGTGGAEKIYSQALLQADGCPGPDLGLTMWTV